MIAKDLISTQIAPLDPNDTSEQALTMMHIYHVKHLPVVSKEDEILAIVSEDDLSQHGMDNKLISYESNDRYHYINENDHLFDVLAKVAERKYTTIPVVNEQEKFIGIIEQETLLQYYADSFSFKEPGSIIVLEIKDSDYLLSEIARLIESENGVILSSFLSKNYGADKSLLTLKLNKKDITAIVATLERFEFIVKASFAEEDYVGNLKERYDSLMKYLDV